MNSFNENITLPCDIETTLDGKPLILHNLREYHGPITMQYLPYGGIQSVYDGELIITTKVGFICPTSITYQGVYYKTPQEFTDAYPNLVNLVLPN